jgi:hypothetical protein
MSPKPRLCQIVGAVKSVPPLMMLTRASPSSPTATRARGLRPRDTIATWLPLGPATSRMSSTVSRLSEGGVNGTAATAPGGGVTSTAGTVLTADAATAHGRGCRHERDDAKGGEKTSDGHGPAPLTMPAKATPRTVP